LPQHVNRQRCPNMYSASHPPCLIPPRTPIPVSSKDGSEVASASLAPHARLLHEEDFPGIAPFMALIINSPRATITTWASDSERPSNSRVPFDEFHKCSSPDSPLINWESFASSCHGRSNKSILGLFKSTQRTSYLLHPAERAGTRTRYLV
jgi:hypothetical protein